MLELGVKAMCLTPNNPLLLFLSSIEEHIFLHEAHQNAGFSLKIFEKNSRVLSLTPQQEVGHSSGTVF